MGMTGSITSPGVFLGWGHKGRVVDKKQEETAKNAQAADESFPPKYAYLILQTGDYRAAFCDPRKFGRCELRSNLAALDALAPDAWLGPAAAIVASLTEKSLGIKALLLDQKRACAGVGNWVADEVLYQCNMHPDQAFLTREEASGLVDSLQSILATSVKCLEDHRAYPDTWLFPYRWTKKKAGKDGNGASITFLKSGGRTSAIIASKQKLYKRKKPSKNHNDDDNDDGKPAAKSNRRIKRGATKDEDDGGQKPAKKQRLSRSKNNTSAKLSVSSTADNEKDAAEKSDVKTKTTSVTPRASSRSKTEKDGAVPSDTTTKEQNGRAAKQDDPKKPRRRSTRLVSS